MDKNGDESSSRDREAKHAQTENPAEAGRGWVSEGGSTHWFSCGLALSSPTLVVQHSPPVHPGDPRQPLSSHSSPLFSDMSDDGQNGGGGGYKLEYCPNNRAACKGTYLPPI